MTFVGVAEAVAGGLLLFFVPGYSVTKAVFPEWRVTGSDGIRRLVEVLTLSFVTSLGLTILVGYALLNLAPGGFAAAWSDPVLETVLAAVAAVAFATALARGAFARTPSAARRPEPSSEGEEGAWEVSRELERLGRDERRLEHALRVAPANSTERTRIGVELESLRAERDALRRRREEEYAA